LVETVKRVASALDNLARTLGAESVAQKKLDEIRQVMSGMGQPSTPGESRIENQYLRLVREGDYANTGEHFRIWELKVDVPTIPAFREGEIRGKPHAQAGDQLWEETDSLTPFRLKRDQKEVGNPEWFQVRHLFVGLKGQPEQAGADAAVSLGEEAGRLLDLSMQCTGGYRFKHLFRATREIPGTEIRAGDFIPVLYGNSDSYHALKVPGRRLPRGQYQTVLNNVSSLVNVALQRPREKFIQYLGNGAARRGKDSTSPILIVRPLRSEVSEPIRASTDDAALFELIRSAGCQMPKPDQT
jgi:hypothetical protein